MELIIRCMLNTGKYRETQMCHDKFQKMDIFKKVKEDCPSILEQINAGHLDLKLEANCSNPRRIWLNCGPSNGKEGCITGELATALFQNCCSEERKEQLGPGESVVCAEFFLTNSEPKNNCKKQMHNFYRRTCCLSPCVLQKGYCFECCEIVIADIPTDCNHDLDKQCLLCDFRYHNRRQFERDNILLNHFSEKHAEAKLMLAQEVYANLDPYSVPTIETFFFIKSSLLLPSYEKSCNHVYLECDPESD